MVSIVLGLISVACWVVCALVVLVDSFLAVGFFVVAILIAPGALGCSVFGVITALLRVRRDAAILVAAALVVNALTPFVGLGACVGILFLFGK
jgi:hypothetical protein